MRITQWGEYATHFCIFFAKKLINENQKSVTATEIAKAHGIDQLYAQQILQRLRKANLIESIRGAQGGYCLAKDISEITLKEILEAAEGETFQIICDSKPIDIIRCSPKAECAVKDIWSELKEHIDSFLESKTLAELTQSNNIPELFQIGSKGKVIAIS